MVVKGKIPKGLEPPIIQPVPQICTTELAWLLIIFDRVV
jgi:hypothetical protein